VNPPETLPGIFVANLRAVLLWDGACGFCAKSVARFQWYARKPVNVIPRQQVADLLPEAVRETMAGQILWISADGAVYGGSEAMIRALRAAGRGGTATCLNACQPFTRLAYHWVARHRHWFGSPVCGLPPRH
jgi:predicted DCC family thiol-disulfide oxidoreductase YuxK